MQTNIIISKLKVIQVSFVISKAEKENDHMVNLHHIASNTMEQDTNILHG